MPDIWPAIVQDRVETRSVEYKGPAPWTRLRHKIKRTAIALANTEDGGHIVIGLRAVNGIYVLQGLTKKMRASYSDIESLQGQVSACASPPLQVTVRLLEDDERCFAVFSILGIQTIPHISTQTELPGRQGITRGVVYMRTEKPATVPCDQFQWEALMNSVETHMASRFLSKMRLVGCGMHFAPQAGQRLEDVEKQFRQERGENEQ